MTDAPAAWWLRCVLMRVLACLQGILSGLKQVDDETAQLASLSDLCELLSISTEESLTTFPVEQIVPLLVRAAAACVCCAVGAAPTRAGWNLPSSTLASWTGGLCME